MGLRKRQETTMRYVSLFPMLLLIFGAYGFPEGLLAEGSSNLEESIGEADHRVERRAIDDSEEDDEYVYDPDYYYDEYDDDYKRVKRSTDDDEEEYVYDPDYYDDDYKRAKRSGNKKDDDDSYEYFYYDS